VGEVELVCIVCPASCTLRARLVEGELKVEGAGCARGIEYAKQELTNPVRHVMTVVKVRCGDLPVVSVITSKPVPKGCIEEVMKATANLEVEAPVELGQVVVEELCDASLVATRRVKRVSGAGCLASPATP
jgi:CxxC motif-containing protein